MIRLARHFTQFGREFRSSFCNCGNKDLRFVDSIRSGIARCSSESVVTKEVTSPVQEDWHRKVIYNEVLYGEHRQERRRASRERSKLRKREMHLYNEGELPRIGPLFVKCFENEEGGSEEETSEVQSRREVHFPLDFKTSVVTESLANKESGSRLSEEGANDVNIETRGEKGKYKVEPPKRWFTEKFKEEEILIEDKRFGTSDPSIPVSSVPCGGCGALLHCTNMTIPGFMPKESFIDLTEEELRKEICQRCLFLKEYDVALGINVKPDEYPKILGCIKNQKALAILMVDLLDFPCSIWPNILDIIGLKRPVFVVGNKLDLLIQDGEKPEAHVKKCLTNALEDLGITKSNIIHVSLVSAKTGYGIERLISNLQAKWGNKGDAYIVGCTNVGKSTLFNALIQSDYCKVQASDVLQRATVSNWPGTTLNLLKFPMLKPLKWRIFLREKRLQMTREKEQALRKLKEEMLTSSEVKKQVSLMGFVGRTFRDEAHEPGSRFTGLDESQPAFKASKWCYDTPGVVHEAQIVHLLTTSELLKVMPQRCVVPRNFRLRPEQTLFIAGIARLDYVSGHCPIMFTVFASEDLPVTITETKDAGFVYETLTGTKYFAVPEGDDERLEKWPSLSSKEFTVNGKFKDVGAADVVLSSAGWIAVTPPPAYRCELRAWTPEGRGLYLRTPSIIRSSSSYRGNKLAGAPAYETNIVIVDDVEVES